jgi:HK97 family phage portal protein
MASNPISNFLISRFITPAVQAQLPTVERATDAFAMGVVPQSTTTFRDALGQSPDTDYDLLYAVTNNHADVSACVAIWAGGVTGNGRHIGLLDKEAEPNRTQRKQIDEITTWLKNPNPTKRFSRLLYEWAEHMAITGDAYINKVTDRSGRVQELWGVHPATMRIVADEHGEIVGYVQRIASNKAEFTPEEISRLQLPSVFNDLYGHSPLESVLQEVHTDLSALRSNRAIIDNGFKPSVILMMKDGVKDAAERVSSLIKQKHTGARNAHGIMTVSGVEKVEQYSSNLKDMEFTQLRTLTTEKVATAYRVPKFMLNQKESADLATSAVQERQFFNGTIKPIQDIIAEVLTEEVIHTFNDELAFYFNEPDFNNADQLRKDALTAEG